MEHSRKSLQGVQGGKNVSIRELQHSVCFTIPGSYVLGVCCLRANDIAATGALRAANAAAWPDLPEPCGCSEGDVNALRQAQRGVLAWCMASVGAWAEAGRSCAHV